MTEKLRILLAAARVNAGMTQEDVARKMHVSKQTVCNWENYKTEPTLTQAQRLSALYNFPFDNINFYPKNQI